MSNYKSYSQTHPENSMRESRNPPKDVPVEGDGRDCRIEWQSTITGFQGHGSVLDRDTAITSAQKAEGQWPKIKHRVNCNLSPTS